MRIVRFLNRFKVCLNIEVGSLGKFDGSMLMERIDTVGFTVSHNNYKNRLRNKFSAKSIQCCQSFFELGKSQFYI